MSRTHPLQPHQRPARTADVLLLLGPTGQHLAVQQECWRLLPLLATRLALPAHACFLEFRYPAIVNVIDQCIQAAVRTVVVLPLAIEQTDHQYEDVRAVLAWERVRHPHIDFRYATPLGIQPALVQVLADRAMESLAITPTISLGETAVVVLGRGSTDPESNADVAKVARLLWEGRPYGWVEPSFYNHTQPDLTAALERCIRLGARQIVVTPYFLQASYHRQRLLTQVQAIQERYPTVPIQVAAHLGIHQGVLEAVAQQYLTVLADIPSRANQPPPAVDSVHTHGQQTGAAFLPPRYRNNTPVSAAPMSAAPLVYDDEGHVAWNKLWGADDPDNPFCALALAGGPPHRNQLLEPVTAVEVNANSAGYARVLAELTRGIQMTTGLQTLLSRAPGWIGVRCHSEEMALWLLRAILVENIAARREGEVLYLPAGPYFHIEHEIKNVITALAKTHHYWIEHLYQ